MRRLNLALLATFQLCRARTPGFNVHSDLLAYPQYEVVFEDGAISDKDAQAFLDGDTHPTYSADFSQPTPATGSRDSNNADGPDDGSGDGPVYSYEVMNLAPHRYLCSIPVIEPPGPENQTANELAKAEEARELRRAAAHGWELLAQLEDSCLYFMSGWWSYSFCNNREIVQFHAMAAVANGQPPRRDPHTQEFVLGRVPTIPATSERRTRQKTEQGPPVPAELQVKGDQRYLVQKLEKGTICDLTGRERTIEVQYHCVPGMKSDRIGWIKEVTICAYVMVVNTPRLCQDVAFLPPEETKANPISCRLIADVDAGTPPLIDESNSAKTGATEAEQQDIKENGKEKASDQREVTIGGIVVGGRRVLSGADEAGKPPVKLTPPRNFLSGQASKDRLIEVVVQAASKADGGKITTLDAAELEKLDLKADVVEEMTKQMQDIAGDSGWKLEIVEIDGEDLRELRGYIDEDEASDKESKKDATEKSKATTGKAEKGQPGKGNAKQGSNKKKAANDKAPGKAEDNDAGSEEKFFKEEL
ncbi:glucosidase II beta subunit-like protein [Purpureocillium lavendulum]|uniref:Endoplasmic reticulum lectin n=1 Tax=Purpureocillium lavendulum TaxID=1247861 RepID=A0AB34FNH7_9HYPO|nr:glucosidase II beta subunit-like protein [Purpureocillium lavendulum]